MLKVPQLIIAGIMVSHQSILGPSPKAAISAYHKLSLNCRIGKEKEKKKEKTSKRKTSQFSWTEIKAMRSTVGFLRSNLVFKVIPPLFSTGHWSSLQQQNIEGYTFFGLRSFQVFPEPQPGPFLCRSCCGNWTQASFFYSASRKKNEGSTSHCIIPDITPVAFPSLVFSSPTTHNTHHDLQTMPCKSRLRAWVTSDNAIWSKVWPRTASFALLWTLYSFPLLPMISSGSTVHCQPHRPVQKEVWKGCTWHQANINCSMHSLAGKRKRKATLKKINSACCPGYAPLHESLTFCPVFFAASTD